ncbi:MAG: hypothetical protein AB1798_19715 [Spirochaetota bacterium]
MFDYEEDFAPFDEDEYRLQDAYFKQALQDITDLYEKDKSKVYFTRQLQVQLEKKYFHWITDDALRYLHRTDKLRLIKERLSEETPLHLYIHPSNRYPKRAIKEIKKLVMEYSTELVTRSCGHRAELLFGNSLMMNGFRLLGQNVNELQGKKWNKTGHNLDFILERDGIFYGCEIKNTLGYIEKEEMTIKLDICKYLGLAPLFIMRFTPKPYFKEILERGGITILFKYQLYEFSQRPLVDKIKNVLELPVDCPLAIEQGTMERMLKLHKKNVNSKRNHMK